MMKFLRVTMPDSTVWDIPAEVIAENRTVYYSAGRGKTYKNGKVVWQEPAFKRGSKEWNDEFKQSMEDDELADWASNNMDWKDVKEFAIQVPRKSKTSIYDDEWSNTEKEVVTHKTETPRKNLTDPTPGDLERPHDKKKFLTSEWNETIGPGKWAREHPPETPITQQPNDTTMEILRKALAEGRGK